MDRCLLIQSGLPKNLWPYAVKAAAYIRNRCYNPRLGITPYEALTKKVPSLSNMHTFGTECFAYVQKKSKLDPRCEKGIFVGYDSYSPAYLVYFANEGTIKKVRCVTFNEKYADKVEEPKEIELHQNCIPDDEIIEENIHLNVNEPANETIDESVNEEISTQPERRYPDRERRQPKHLDNFVTDTAKSTLHYCYRISPPDTYEEAIQSPLANEWQKAMEKEMDVLKENDTFEEVLLPENKSTVGGRWVYIFKDDPIKGEECRSRYVAKGFSQKKGVDYQETFSPTAKMTSLRMLLQISKKKKLLVHQMDVCSAYLHAPIDTEIFIDQPKGFIKTDQSGRKLVWRLKKSLYGLKQSGRNWNNVLHEHLLNDHFCQSLADPCLYTKFENGNIILLLVWVDDLVIAANNYDVLNSVKENFNKFKMKDMGVLKQFLGIHFSFTDDCILMNQTKYCLKILDRFNMTDCKPKSIPCDSNINSINEDSQELADPRLYRVIVGSLIYVMVGTRPDICYAVTKLSQYMSKPTKAHLGLAKDVLRYLKSTINFGLKFSNTNEPLKLNGYCDSDWGNSEDRRSITGYCYQLNENGPLISWKSQKQRIVALSSCEAEYISLTSAVQEGNFLRQLFADMTNTNKTFVTLNIDNQGAISYI